MTTQQPEALRALAEAAKWTGKWYDAGCNTVYCTYDKEYSILHDEIAHPVPFGVSGYIAAAHPQAVIALLDRIAELESELEAVGAGGVSGPLMGIAAPPTAQAEGWISVQDELPKCSKKPDSFGVEVLIWPPNEDGSRTAFYGRRQSREPNFYKYGALLGHVEFWRYPPPPPTSAEGVEHG